MLRLGRCKIGPWFQNVYRQSTGSWIQILLTTLILFTVLVSFLSMVVNLLDIKPCIGTYCLESTPYRQIALEPRTKIRRIRPRSNHTGIFKKRRDHSADEERTSPEQVRQGSEILTEDAVFDNVRVIIYQRASNTIGMRPAVIFMHGGGWLTGDPRMSTKTKVFKTLIKKAVIFSIGYRISTDQSFPVPYDDCRRAAVAIIKSSEKRNIDNRNIAIMGGSSGGTLAAAVALAIRNDPSLPKLKAQILANAPLQVLDFNTDSYLQFNNKMLLIRRKMITFWVVYALGYTIDIDNLLTNKFVPSVVLEKYASRFNNTGIPIYRRSILTTTEKYDIEESRKTEMLTDMARADWLKLEHAFLDPRFAPLMAENFESLPHTIFYVGQHDILRDDSILYAQQLRKAGVPVTFLLDRDGYHGDFWMRSDESGFTEALEHVFD